MINKAQDFYIDFIISHKDILTSYSDYSLFIFISLYQFIKIDSLKGINVCITKLMIQYIDSLLTLLKKSSNGKMIIDEVDTIFKKLERNNE